MEIAKIIPHVEALIFSSDHPLPPMEIVELLNNAQGFLEDRATMEQVEAAIEAIVEKYQSEFYAFEIRQSGGGYQFLTKPAYYPTVVQLNGDKYLKKLSTAALETLAIIAYRQPVTKGDIESIRGVNSDYSIQKLLEKELIIISGRNEEMPGKPLLYNTSRSFMDYFGLNSPEDLPKIKEIIGEELVDPTRAVSSGEEENSMEAGGPHLEVSETGELRLNNMEPLQGDGGDNALSGAGEPQEATLYIDEVMEEQGEEPVISPNGDADLLGGESEAAGEIEVDLDPVDYEEDEGAAIEGDETLAFVAVKDNEGGDRGGDAPGEENDEEDIDEGEEGDLDGEEDVNDDDDDLDEIEEDDEDEDGDDEEDEEDEEEDEDDEGDDDEEEEDDEDDEDDDDEEEEEDDENDEDEDDEEEDDDDDDEEEEEDDEDDEDDDDDDGKDDDNDDEGEPDEDASGDDRRLPR